MRKRESDFKKVTTHIALFGRMLPFLTNNRNIAQLLWVQKRQAVLQHLLGQMAVDAKRPIVH